VGSKAPIVKKNHEWYQTFTTTRRPPLAKAPLPDGKKLWRRTYDMKLARTVTVSFLLLSSSFVTVRAAELCFQLNNFTDLFSLEFTSVGVNTLVLGQDLSIGPGTQSYALPLTGSTVTAPPPNTDPAITIVGLHGVNTSRFFGNHADCTIDFRIGTSPLVLNLACVGRTSGLFNRTNVPATIITCTLAAQAKRSVPAGAKAWGEGQGDSQ
jgi:hypothetical protein